ncbi:MAG: GEVED domain-containing protein, partial [Ferruginibacter sp.]
MKLKFLQTKTKRFLLKSIFALSLLSIISAATFAQYSNGNLSTGATTNSGTAAPAGFTWSEVQLTNASAGLSASVQNGFSVADDFVVPVGQTWTLTKVTFYAYSTGYAGATSPFNDTRVRIFNTNPSVGAPVPVFGDLTTNRFSASTSAAMYRIFPTPANPSGTTRHIWKIEATVATVLTAGTYWIEWQHNPIVVASSNFSPAVTVVGTTTQAGNNALQHTIAGNTWAAILDGTPAGPQAMPFDITYTASGAPCTGTPAPGNTLSTITTGCLGVPFSLSLQNATTGIGVTYQWQSGTSLTGPWTNIGGATNNTYSSSVSTGGFYRCNVTCGANTGASNGVQVALTPASGCYCANTATDPADEDILNVTLGTLNNTSTCTSVGPGFGSVVKQYANYTSGTGAPAAPNVIQGAANPISVQVGTCNGNWGNMVAVWIDLNQDGTFQHPAERVFISPASVTGPNTQVGNVVIPATALLGTTRMRVQVREFGTAANMVPCGNFTWGEVEDYNVNIVPCIPVTITTAPANATAVCGGNASFSVVAAGSIPAYQWQSKSTVVGSLWTNIAGATSATLNLTGVTGALSGYQYRVLFSGACTSPNVTTAATLTVNPITAAVTPTSALLCQGGVQQLTITNIASPSPGSVTVNSATLNMNVPDDNPAGVNTTITIPALPAGATVIGASVKLNVASTWVGDLNVNLKAPNNQILNLSHNLSVTNGNASGGGSFVNTVIGSAFTTPLHTSSSPASTHTGNYKADAGTITVSGITPNVTGFVPSTASWNSLLTTPSGVWTLAMADIWGGGDITTFQNWSLTIDYLLGSPATGVYTGPTGTIYTDAAATVPYTGTAIN